MCSRKREWCTTAEPRISVRIDSIVQLKIRDFAIEVSARLFNLGRPERGEELGSGVRYLPITVSTQVGYKVQNRL